MAVMMGTYYAMDRMSKMKGEKKNNKKDIFKLSGKSIEQLEGGRGGLIVNTASAAGLVFNQVGHRTTCHNPQSSTRLLVID